mgnify:CR=1 FL=1
MKRFPLRLDEQLWEALKDRAGALGKSVNEFLLELIRQGLSESETQALVQVQPSMLEMLKVAVGKFQKDHGRMPSVSEAAKASGLSYMQVWNLRSKLESPLLTTGELKNVLWAERKRARLWSLPPWISERLSGECDRCEKPITVGFEDHGICDGWITKEGKELCDSCLNMEDKAEKERYLQHRKATVTRYGLASRYHAALFDDICARCGKNAKIAWADSEDHLICENCITDEDAQAVKEHQAKISQ